MRVSHIFMALVVALAPLQAQACETALVLTIDVSNSVDGGEFILQTEGLADALRDPEIIDAMVSSQAHLAVVQWSGADKQELTIPWTPILTEFDALALSDRARNIQRAFVLSDTAPAEAIWFSLGLFDGVPHCEKRVIDVSGDGTPNSGSETRDARNAAERANVTINGIAIESMGLAITNYYRNAVITRNGFVITARTHRDYPNAIRSKILRELSLALG